MSAKANSATVCAPYLGTLHTVIPFSFAYAISMWSKPVDRVAMHFKLGRASICSFLNSEDVKRETTFASGFFASASAETMPSRYTTVWSFSTGAKILRVASSELKMSIFMFGLYCMQGTNGRRLCAQATAVARRLSQALPQISAD